MEVEEILQGENVVMLVVPIRAKGRGSGVPRDQRFAHVWTSLEDGRGVTFQWFVSREEGLAASPSQWFVSREEGVAAAGLS